MLEYAQPLMLACGGSTERQLEVVRAVVGRLFDVDESVRRAATAAVAALLAASPQLAASTHTEGRGSVLSCLMARLRDKKLAVRREAATHLAALTRSWAAASVGAPAEEPGAAAAGGGAAAGAAPSTHMVLAIPLVICNLAVRDVELGVHVFDTVFRSGIFPAKLAPGQVAHLWALMWQQAGESPGPAAGSILLGHSVRCSAARPFSSRAGLLTASCYFAAWLAVFDVAGEEGRPMLTKILQGKASMQQKVQELLSLRVAAKEQRTASLAGAASSMGGGGGGGGGALGSAHGGLRSGISGSGGGQRLGDPEKHLQELVQALAGVLGDVSKPEEGGWCGLAWRGFGSTLLLLCCLSPGRL